MDMVNPAIRRLCIAVALHQERRQDGSPERFSRPSKLLSLAGPDSVLDRALWYCQAQGSGELALLPPGVDEGRVIDHFIREAALALVAHNRGTENNPRTRLGIAFHQGLTYVMDSGYTGPAVTATCGLIDSHALTETLLNNVDADLAVIVSQSIFEEVILPAGDCLSAREFASVQIQQPSGGRLSAWIRAGIQERLPGDETTHAKGCNICGPT